MIRTNYYFLILFRFIRKRHSQLPRVYGGKLVTRTEMTIAAICQFWRESIGRITILAWFQRIIELFWNGKLLLTPKLTKSEDEFTTFSTFGGISDPRDMSLTPRTTAPLNYVDLSFTYHPNFVTLQSLRKWGPPLQNALTGYMGCHARREPINTTAFH